jgi:uncharacterized protein YjdB
MSRRRWRLWLYAQFQSIPGSGQGESGKMRSDLTALSHVARRRAIRQLIAAGMTAMLVVACAGGGGLADGIVAPPTQGGTSAPVATSLSIAPDSIAAAVGDSTQLVATAYGANGAPVAAASVQWVSADPSVVVITSGGYAKAVDSGQTVITATMGAMSARARAYVFGSLAASIGLSPTSATLQVGQSVQVTATVRNFSNSVIAGRTVHWTSSQPTVATVDSAGNVTGVSAGSATITAQSGRVAASMAATVVNAPPATSALPGTVNDLSAAASSDSSMAIRFTAVNDGTGHPANYEIRYQPGGLTWGTANPVLLGTCKSPITGPAIGTAVQCTVLGLVPSTTYAFQVVAYRGTPGVNAVLGGPSNVASAITPAAAAPTGPVASSVVTSVTETPASVSDTVGQSAQFSAVVKDQNGNVMTGQTIAWSTSNSSVATVSGSGLMSAVGAGSATITASVGGKSSTASVAVVAATAAVSKPGTVTDLAVSTTSDSSATISFTTVSDGTGHPAGYDLRYAAGTLIWGSATSVSAGSCKTPLSETTVGTKVQCTVLGLSAATGYQFQIIAFRGTLNVNAVFGGLSNVAGATTAASSVTPAPSPVVTTVSVTPTTGSATVGQWAQFSAVVKDQNGNVMTGQTVSWTSSNTAVAAVNSTGLVAAVAAGSATITATSGGKSGTAAFTATAAPSGTGTLGASGVYPNLPAGMSVSIVDDFNNASMQEAGFVVANQNGGSFTRQDGSTWNPGGGINPPGVGPVSSPYVGAAYFPAGMPTGVAPGSVSQDLTSHGWSHLYVAFWFKVSSNWSGNTVGISKLGYIWINGKPEIYFTVNGAGSNPLAFSAYLQDAPIPKTLSANQGADASCVRDTWYRIEVETIANTPGSANGVFREWLTKYNADGTVASAPTLVTEYTNLEYVPSGGSTTWGIFSWQPVYGGSGNPVPYNMYQFMDRIAVAGH